MLAYSIRRFWQSLLVLIIVTMCAFLLVRLAPGNPARLILPDEATEEQVRLMEIKLGLDKPLPVQYWNYIMDLLRGDLGTSIVYKQPASRIIFARVPNTVLLALSTIFVGCMLAIPLGVIAGTHRGSPVDLFSMLFALLGQSMSTMWLGVLLIWVFAVRLRMLPAMGTGGWEYLVLPVLSMAYPMSATTTRIARSGMVDTLSEDYVVALYAKGVSRMEMYSKYALRNAMIPVSTMLGLNLGIFLAGSVVTETIFGWAGMGQLMNQSVLTRDYPMVQSLLLISAIMFTVINLIVDIINSFIDPRLSIN
ncbi:MAG: ABC transporter permease [Clostridiales bacterium]|nr:ABC transporter permease [Clostridiales bacterium]